jgi:hypothetical protein
VRHVLDVMHCEKNIVENILKTTFGKKDTPAVRADLQARGIIPHLHLNRLGLTAIGTTCLMQHMSFH